MKKIIAFLFLYFVSPYFSLASLTSSDSIIFNAMRDEIKRSIAELKLDQLEKPYFIEYYYVTSSPSEVQASLGSLISSKQFSYNYITVNLRVGDYKFDNTNFFDVGLSFFGSGDEEEKFKKRVVAKEIDYDNIRREFWLATDAAYKQSAEIFSKKVASLKNKMLRDTIPDFLKIQTEKELINITYPNPDMEILDRSAIDISSVLNGYNSIHSSSYSLEYSNKVFYYVNSEGIEFKKGDCYGGQELVAFTQASDGMPIMNFVSDYTRRIPYFISQDSMKSLAKQMADKVVEFSNAQVLEDDYNGPVLFEKQASAEIFSQFFAPNLIAQRPTLTETGVQEIDRYGAFQTKIGGRVLPEFLSVLSKPNTFRYKNRDLLGAYNFDDDGVAAIDTTIVLDGYLKFLLSSRIPTKKIRSSNGSKRSGAPMFSNLFVESKEDKAVSYDSLKKVMIELIKKRNLQYGVIIRKILNPNIMYTSMYRIAYGMMTFPKLENGFVILEAYKIFPDGTEKPFRGGVGNGISASTFKEIVLTSNNPYLYNFLAPAVISSYVTGGDQYIPCSVVVPDLLFEDLEIKVMDEDFKKTPILSTP